MPEIPPLGIGRVRAIRNWPDPVLREMAEPAGELDGDSIARIAADLLVTMYDAEGRGLAAPQIGIPRRIFVYDAHWKTDAPHPMVMVDPVITWHSAATDIVEEGCLSIPGHPVAVLRPTAITVEYFDLSGSARRADLTGIEARIVQHEYDHLNGRLILDLEEPDASALPDV